MRRLCGINATCSLFWTWFCCVSVVLFCSQAIANDREATALSNEDEYVLAVFPYLAPRQIENIYAPITAALSEALGRQVRLTSSLSYTKFVRSLNEESFDLVFVQPFDYVSIADAYGYQPLVTRDEPLPAILVVADNSPVKTLSDLRDKIIALPPEVAAVSRLVKDHLIKSGYADNLDNRLQYQKSHFACMHQVIVGKAQACGTAPPAVRFFRQKTDAKLRVISQTMAIPNSLFAAHPRVSPQERQKIVDTMMSWPGTAEGKKLLERAKVKAFVPIDDSAYDIVRAMSQKEVSKQQESQQHFSQQQESQQQVSQKEKSHKEVTQNDM
jgi:phosphonate transport system substrate-binding protein